MIDDDVHQMIKIYRQPDMVYRLATRTMKALLDRAFEGELIARKRRGQDIFDPEIRVAAARDALKGIRLPVLRQDEHLARGLVEQEIIRLATARRRN